MWPQPTATRVAPLLAAAALAAALAAPAPAGGPGRRADSAYDGPPSVWRARMRRVAGYARGRRGTVMVALRLRGRLYGLRPFRVTVAASVVKVMLLAAYLRARRVQGRPLHRGDRRLLGPMIRRSDNGAASRVRDLVGNAGLRRVARRAGLRRFSPARPWGNSRITAADMARLMLHLRRLLPARHRTYALRLLATVVAAQRWGVARERPRGWRLYFKGGWGSGSGAVDHQVALLVRGRHHVALAVLTEGNGSHAYGKGTLRGVAARLLHGL